MSLAASEAQVPLLERWPDTALTRLDFSFADCDALVIGAGFAGMFVAGELAAKGLDVVLASSGRPAKSGASLMANGYAAVVAGESSADSIEQHVSDTLSVGDELNDGSIVETVCGEAPRLLTKLVDLGVRFEHRDGSLVRYSGGGHAYPRTVMSVPRTPSGFATPLLARLRDAGVREMPGLNLLSLIAHCDGADDVALGALFVLEASGELLAVAAGATVIATGGYCRLFEHSSNPNGLYGDGCMAAFEAGASLRDLEFVQFRPYSLVKPHALRSRSFASATFEYGATLRGAGGVDLLARARAQGKEITRDVVSRLIAEQVNQGAGIDGGVVVDLGAMEEGWLERTNPVLAQQLAERAAIHGEESIVVAPQAHFSMGGVAVDASGRTDLERLFVVGEAGSGMHGASRLQDNALPELFVIGQRAAEVIAANRWSSGAFGFRRAAETTAQEVASRFHGKARNQTDLDEAETRVRAILSEKVGPARNESGLRVAGDVIFGCLSLLRTYCFDTALELLRLTNLRRRFELAGLIVEGAQLRSESRGAHFRLDHPYTDPNWRRSTFRRSSLEKTP